MFVLSIIIGEIFRLNASDATSNDLEIEVQFQMIETNLIDDCRDEHVRVWMHRRNVRWNSDLENIHRSIKSDHYSHYSMI